MPAGGWSRITGLEIYRDCGAADTIQSPRARIWQSLHRRRRFRAATERELTNRPFDVELDPRHPCEQVDIGGAEGASAKFHVGRYQIERLQQDTHVLENERIGERAVLP